MEGPKAIRWGIPGWILTVCMLLLYTIVNFDLVIEFIQSNTVKVISVSAILTGVGIPLGYLIHEIYFSLFWSIRKIDTEKITDKVNDFPFPDDWSSKKNKEKYYYIEFVWDRYLNLQQEGIRDQIKDRFRDRLTLIHSLGTLLLSMILSTVITLITIMSHQSLEIFLAFILQLIVVGSIIINYRYHSLQLMDYQGYYINTMINENLNNNN